jgi:hypothetical protein
MNVPQRYIYMRIACLVKTYVLNLSSTVFDVFCSTTTEHSAVQGCLCSVAELLISDLSMEYSAFIFNG